MPKGFLNEIVNEEKNINEEIFRNYFKYQNPSSLVKDLIKADKNKKDKIRYLIINQLIKLKEDINLKEIPENENPKKVASIVEKLLNFKEQQKGRGCVWDLAHVAKVIDHTCIKILTP